MVKKDFKFCAGITLFNPTLKEIDNVIMYTNIFERVYVYDNSLEEYDRGCLYRSGIEIISLGSNDGVGKACRMMTEQAQRDHYDYIMLFDQDSEIDSENVMRIIEFIKRQEVDAMLFCPQIIFNKKNKVIKREYEFVDWCITSGTVIKLEDYGANIKFDDKYFIDRVDKDLSYQVLKNNKKICQINDAILYQQLGETSVNGYSTHLPFRHYYISRNRLYFNKKFGKSIVLSVLQTLKHICIVIKYEPEKLKKIKMIFKGIADYRKGKMGCM